MASLLMVTAAIFTGIAAISFILFRSVWSRREETPSPEWLETITPRRYRAMERLLSLEDCQFVLRSSDADSRLVRRLRAERRQIFRLYLRSLQRDFDRVCLLTRATLDHTEAGQADLSALLMKQQMTFRVALLGVQLRLGLHALGFDTPIDTRVLVGSFDALRTQIGSLAPQTGAASA